jgi:hypothetical protein
MINFYGMCVLQIIKMRLIWNAFTTQFEIQYTSIEKIKYNCIIFNSKFLN